jgi:ABC-type Zn2+ transport system substrate-binding protein/surface adhesin
MNFFWKKIKLFTSGLLVILFILASSVSSCNTKKSGSDDTEQNVNEEAEHPSDDAQEHPTDQEHPADHEHPADSASESGEHPTN